MKQLPYGTQTNWMILHDAQRWCRDQWGPRWQAASNRQGTWCVVWGGKRVENRPSTYQWWFETEQQRSWFMLRWS